MKISKNLINRDTEKVKNNEETFDERWETKFGMPRTKVLPTDEALKLLHEMVMFS